MNRLSLLVLGLTVLLTACVSVDGSAANNVDGGADAAAPPDAAGQDPPDLLPACGPPLCAGCCQGAVCMPGTSALACGTAGKACVPCKNAVQTCLAGGHCGLNPEESWDLIVESARISANAPDGSAWDFPGGAPDPYVTFGGVRVTLTEQDTNAPSWGSGSTYTLAQLQGGISIAVWDKDVTVDDNIAGPQTLLVTESDLLAGKIVWMNWSYVREITFSLRKNP